MKLFPINLSPAVHKRYISSSSIFISSKFITHNACFWLAGWFPGFDWMIMCVQWSDWIPLCPLCSDSMTMFPLCSNWMTVFSLCFVRILLYPLCFDWLVVPLVCAFVPLWAVIGYFNDACLPDWIVTYILSSLVIRHVCVLSVVIMSYLLNPKRTFLSFLCKTLCCVLIGWLVWSVLWPDWTKGLFSLLCIDSIFIPVS